MKKFETSLYKKTQQVEIRLFALQNLQKESNLCKMLKIISLFELQGLKFIGEGFVGQDSAFLTAPKDIDSSIEVTIKKTRKALFSKKLTHEVEVIFCGKWLNDIVRLTANENTTLFIIPVGEQNSVSQVELLINDNDYSSMTFRIDKYDQNKITAQINEILNEKY